MQWFVQTPKYSFKDTFFTVYRWSSSSGRVPLRVYPFSCAVVRLQRMMFQKCVRSTFRADFGPPLALITRNIWSSPLLWPPCPAVLFSALHCTGRTSRRCTPGSSGWHLSVSLHVSALLPSASSRPAVLRDRPENPDIMPLSPAHCLELGHALPVSPFQALLPLVRTRK